MAAVPFLLHILGMPYLKYSWNQIHEIMLEMLQFAFFKWNSNLHDIDLSLLLNSYEEFMLKIGSLHTVPFFRQLTLHQESIL